MGYQTEFEGTLTFKAPLIAEQELFLRTICSGDCENTDDHPEWKKPPGYTGYIQLEITSDKSGIKWDGNEKFYDAIHAVNTFPDFGLEGKLLAQGEILKDRWELVIAHDGYAAKQKIKIEGDCYQCPSCGEEVYAIKAKKINK